MQNGAKVCRSNPKSEWQNIHIIIEQSLIMSWLIFHHMVHKRILSTDMKNEKNHVK